MKKCAVYILVGITRFLALFPLGFHYFWADVAAWILRSVFGYRREVIAINLARAFPEAGYDHLVWLEKMYYKHIAEIAVEMIWFSGSSAKRFRKSGIMTIRNAEVLERAYKQSPCVVVLNSHCGNWEILGGLPHAECLDLDSFPFPEENIRCVYKELTSKVSDEFFKKSRLSMSPSPEIVLESRKLLRYMLMHRNDKLAYLLTIDQSPYVSAVEIGTFMSQKTKAFLGPAEVASKLGFSVLYLNFDRIERGRYEVSFEEICMDASTMEPKEIVRSFYDKLEAEIHRHPENWLWSHKRWN
ncbi:MAG: lysophospholipid acyltransferase family protein [Candidatus Cryptobacteroides sp.]